MSGPVTGAFENGEIHERLPSFPVAHARFDHEPSFYWHVLGLWPGSLRHAVVSYYACLCSRCVHEHVCCGLLAYMRASADWHRTEWFNVDNPDTGDGDEESREKLEGQICGGRPHLGVHCQVHALEWTHMRIWVRCK